MSTDPLTTASGTQAGSIESGPGPPHGSPPTRRPVAGDAPTSVGEYDLVRKIGAGGMGLVYLARHRGLGREVALKVLRMPPGARDEAIQRFLREARAASRLTHPGIAPVFESGRDQDLLYYSMEFVDGGSLADVVAERRPAPRQAMEWIGQAARALAHAHEAGVLHRDIKPQNLLLGRDGRIRIVDFGLAKDLDSKSELTREGQTLGTPAYMSPEQAEGAVSTLGAASDVYSLGAVLYFLLTGAAPFEGETPFSVVKKVILDPAVPVRRRVPAVARDIETLCMKCLEKVPALRYPTAAALADDVAAYLEGAPISARPPGVLERAARFARRHRAATLAAATVVLSLCAAVVDRHVRAQEQQEATERERVRLAQAHALARSAAERLQALDQHPPAAFPSGLAEVARELDRALLLEPEATSVRLFRAEVAWLAIDPARAARELTRAREANDDDPEVEYAHVRLYHALLDARLGDPIPGFLAAAERCGERLRARTGTDLGARARLRHALRLGRAGEIAAGLADLAGSASAGGADLRYLRAAAEAFQPDLEPERRLQSCDELVRVAPRRLEHWRLRASVLQALGRFPAAAEDRRTCLALQTSPLRVDLVELCRTLFDAAAGEPEHRAALERVAEEYPNDPEAWRWLVAFHRRAGDLDAAAAALDRWQAVAPHPLASVRERYEVAQARHDREAAEAILDRTLAALRPEDLVAVHGGECLSGLADALRDAGRAEVARELLERCRRAAPADPFLAFELAQTWMSLGRPVEAAEAYGAAIAAWPANADLYQRRARALRKSKDLGAMARDLQRAVELEPANPRYRSRLAMALLATGRADQALDQLVEAIYRTPTLEIQQRLHRWSSGDFDDDEAREPARGSVDPQKALAASIVRPLLPRLARRLIERGAGALEERDSLRVLRSLSAAALVQPESPAPYLHLARFHARQQAWPAAVLCLERALELGFDGLDRLPADPDLRPLLWFPEIHRRMEGR